MDAEIGIAQIGIAAIAFRFKTAASDRFFARRGSGHGCRQSLLKSLFIAASSFFSQAG
jgi:hypothetical protein